MKKTFLSLILILFCVFVFADIERLEIPRCKGNATDVFQNTQDDTDSKRNQHEIVAHDFFELCYREYFEESEWVAYVLTREELTKDAFRQNNFRPDSAVSTGSASLEDYRKSGFDRGHLAPAGDMAFSKEAMSQSFFMSNMSPQVPGFNRGIWKTLEDAVRSWAERFGKVYVVTGPILENKEYPTIGKNHVAVPEYFYKVLLAPTTENESENISSNSYIMIAFILPNASSDKTIWDYVVSVDEVEKRSGIDFFYLLPDEIENELESKIEMGDWK